MIVPRGRNYMLDIEAVLSRSPAELFAYFSEAHNLQELTPGFLQFKVLTHPPIQMGVGTLIDYRLRVHGVPVRWRTRISAWDPPHRFVDEQLHGPYRLWRHEHTFEAHRSGTRMCDRVEFRSRGGPLAPLLHRLFVNADVASIFDYRMRVLSERFGGVALPQNLG